MREIVEDALFLEQPGNEVQVALPVLDAVLARRVARHKLRRHVDVGDAGLLQHILNNLRDGLVLKNTAVRVQR